MFTRITRYVPAILALAPALASAATLNVPSADYPTLPIAINAAASGDEIVLEAGTYLAVPGFVVTNKQLTFRGVTGDPADVVLDGFGVNNTTVLTINGSASNGTVLDSLTIMGGLNPASEEGAGVRVSGADLFVNNCVVRDNRVSGSEDDAAGIYVESADCFVTNSTFMRNATGPAGDAAAIFVLNGNLDVSDSHFEDNGQDAGTFDTGAYAGAIRVDGGAMYVKRSTFLNNRCGRGGAIYLGANVSLRMDACVLQGNSGIQGGAIYCQTGTTAMIRNCLFRGQETSSNDAAIFTNGASMHILNCTLVENIAGGSYIVGGSPAAGSVVIDNSILWDNTENINLTPSGMAAVVRHCIIESATGGSGSGNNLLVDPEFRNHPDNFHLKPSSPGIDAGNSDLYVGPFADLDGNLRGMDIDTVADVGTSIDGPVMDIGCYEFQPEITIGGTECPGDVNGDLVVNFTDLNELLEHWDDDCN